MNLHNDIMNIPVNVILDGPEGVGNVSQNRYIAYKEGHRDARHAAAELSLKADARIEELESSLEWVLQGFKSVLAGKSVRDADEIICHVEKLLGNNK